MFKLFKINAVINNLQCVGGVGRNVGAVGTISDYDSKSFGKDISVVERMRTAIHPAIHLPHQAGDRTSIGDQLRIESSDTLPT